MRFFQRPSSLASNSVIYLAANLFSAAIPFLLLPVLTRYLSPSEYGQVALFQTVATGLGAIVGLSVHGAANRKFYDVADSPKEMRDFIGACLQILIVSSVLVGGLMLLIHQELSRELGLDDNWLGGCLLVTLSSFIINLRLSQWLVRRRAFRYGFFQVSQAGTSFGLAILAVVVMAQHAEGRIWSIIATSTLFAFLALVSLARDELLGISWRPAYIREALAFGVPLIPHIAGVFLLGMADRLLINQTLGPAPVGVYMVAAQVAAVLAILADAVNKAYVPWLYERLKQDSAAENRRIVRYTYLYFAAALLLAGVAAMAGPWLITLLAGRAYAAASSLIGWLALGQAFGGMYLMVTNYVFYSRKTGPLSVVTICSGAVNILLILALIPLLGTAGAAIAYALSMGLRFLLTWWLAQRVHPMPWLGGERHG